MVGRVWGGYCKEERESGAREVVSLMICDDLAVQVRRLRLKGAKTTWSFHIRLFFSCFVF